MAEQTGNGLAAKLSGAGTLLAAGATAAGLASGREWAELAQRAGYPSVGLFLVVWGLVKLGGFLAPLLPALLDFVKSVKAGNETLVKVQCQQANTLERLEGAFAEVLTEQRETNRLLRSAAETPVPPLRASFPTTPKRPGPTSSED